MKKGNNKILPPPTRENFKKMYDKMKVAKLKAYKKLIKKREYVATYTFYY